jgi:hypothetical protein
MIGFFGFCPAIATLHSMAGMVGIELPTPCAQVGFRGIARERLFSDDMLKILDSDEVGGFGILKIRYSPLVPPQTQACIPRMHRENELAFSTEPIFCGPQVENGYLSCKLPARACRLRRLMDINA